MKTKHEPVYAEVESLSHDGRGVARIDGKVYFIDQALAGEQVTFLRGKRRKSFETGRMLEIIQPSPDRVQPACEYFGVCGGCAMQHLATEAQIRAKHAQLVDNLNRIGNVSPANYEEPMTGNQWGYRRKARLGVRFVPKKGGVLVGFREKGKSYITPLDHCAVLDPQISTLLPGLKSLIELLSCSDRIPQIEVAVGDNAASLVFRHLDELTHSDRENLINYAVANNVQIYLQAKGLDSVQPLSPARPDRLFYTLTKFDLKIFFEPTDFVQVNRGLNEALIEWVVDELDPNDNENVLDLFCGVGNFTLPIARRAGNVVGLEGEHGLVDRARSNSTINSLSNTDFETVDLYGDELSGNWIGRHYDKVLLDPPRSGALEAMNIMNKLSPSRIVYVSCNPATLARDAGILVHDSGYQLTKAGVIDMFPHTTHVESIAVFER